MKPIHLLQIAVLCLSAYADEDSATISLENMVVTARRRDDNVTNVRLHEEQFGLQDNITEVIFSTPGINRLPESGSMLLVHGAGPYDNQYYVSGIPVFPPSHFVTHTFADRGGAIVACVTDVEVLTLDAAGRRPEGAGSVFSFDPGIWRAADPKLKKRPEFALNYGTLDADLALSFPSFRREGFYQVSLKISDDAMLGFLGGNDNSDERDRPLEPSGTAPGWGIPKGYRDLTLTGETGDGHLRRRLHFWLAFDRYRHFISPWGIGSYTIEEQTASPSWRLTVGGSNQKHLEAKFYGPHRPRKRIDRSNLTVFFEREAIPFGDFDLELDSRLHFLHWSGYQSVPEGNYAHSYFDTTTWIPEHDPSVLEADGDELELATHAGATRRFNNFVIESHVLLDAVAGDGFHLYPDQSIEGKLFLPRGSISANVNVSTMRPDIRGLPSRRYRYEPIRRYSLSTEFAAKPVSVLEARLRAYLNYFSGYPRISPEPWNLAYAPDHATDLITRGITADMAIRPISNVQLSVIANYGRSFRVDSKGNRERFEWDLPWSIRPTLSLTFSDGLLLIVARGVFAEGLPYRDLYWSGQDVVFGTSLSRMPPYRRLDLQVELRHPVEEHRFLTRYDGYLHIRNVADLFDGFAGPKSHYWRNTREYTWDESLQRRDVGLDLFRVAIGVRLGIRL